MSAFAEDNRDKVEVLVVEENVAIFSAEGYASNKKEAILNAIKSVMYRLLYDGVEDFNDGSPIVASGHGTNLWLKNFFDGEMPAYKNLVGGIELVDMDKSPSGEVHCKTNVIVRYTQLLQQATAQGVTGGNKYSQKNTSRPQTAKSGKKSFL